MVLRVFGFVPQSEFASFPRRLFLAATFALKIWTCSVQCHAQVFWIAVIFELLAVPSYVQFCNVYFSYSLYKLFTEIHFFVSRHQVFISRIKKKHLAFL